MAAVLGSREYSVLFKVVLRTLMAWVMLVLKALSWLVSLVLTTLALKLTPSCMGVSLQGADLCQLSVMRQLATCRCSTKTA